MRNRYVLSLLLVVTSGLPSSLCYAWPSIIDILFKRPPPKTQLEEMIELADKGLAYCNEHKMPILAAVIAAGAFRWRKELLRAGANSYDVIKTTYNAHPQAFNRLGMLSLLTGAGLVIHKNCVDQVLLDVAQEYPFMSGCVIGTTAAGCAAIAFLKNVLKKNKEAFDKNAKLIGNLDDRMKQKDHVHAISILFALGNWDEQAITGHVQAINDDGLIAAWHAYKSDRSGTNGEAFRKAVLAKMYANV